MQLTKDDVTDFTMKGREWLDYSKFQQVVEFYEKYKITEGQDNPGFLLFRDEQPEIYKKYNEDRIKQPFGKLHYNNWLFSYCFLEGLK
jgi:hypothetical protein